MRIRLYSRQEIITYCVDVLGIVAETEVKYYTTQQLLDLINDRMEVEQDFEESTMLQTTF